MAYTGHGHHIPGTNKGEGVTKVQSVVKCGGVEVCPKCKEDVETHWFMVGENVDYPAKAKAALTKYLAGMYAGKTISVDVYVIWFAKTLQNWKGVLGTTLPDGMLYEVTYNGAKHEAYIDAYQKIDNVVIPD